MEIRHYVDNKLLNMRLIDMRCKHATDASEKGREVIRLSTPLGYDFAQWGLNGGHTDIRYHADVIMKMEEDNYCHPERIVICSYDFQKEPCIWLDNIHSAVRYVRKFGGGVKVKDIPFYVIDISNLEAIVSENGEGVLDMNMQHISEAIFCAWKRKERSDSKELIDLNYRLGDLLTDNQILLTCRHYFGTGGAVRGAKSDEERGERH